VSPLCIDRCVCRQILFADLLPRVRAGAWQLPDLIRETGCGGSCGLCQPYLRAMIGTGRTVFDEIILE